MASACLQAGWFSGPHQLTCGDTMERPTRCVDPVIKYCQGCLWGHIVYPDWVETYEDSCECTFSCFCTLGYDKGRPEDEPTAEELAEFDEWCRQLKESYKNCNKEEDEWLV